MTTLYPIFYGMRLVTFDVIEATFRPNMHPEAWRRHENFMLHQGGKFGPGGGRRLRQPVKPGFAPEGMSFHQDQDFPSGYFYCAIDYVVVNPGYNHRSPRWEEVPIQGRQLSIQYGIHMNVGYPPGGEPWHGQPTELDGYTSWVTLGKPDLRTGYPIVLSGPRPQPPQPPTNPNPITTKEIAVQFFSRTLKEGCIGNDVKSIQKKLNDLAGQGLLQDGDYGPKTTIAVRNWQFFFKETSDHKPLTPDGVCGALTLQSIFEVELAVGG